MSVDLSSYHIVMSVFITVAQLLGVRRTDNPPLERDSNRRDIGDRLLVKEFLSIHAEQEQNCPTQNRLKDPCHFAGLWRHYDQILCAVNNGNTNAIGFAIDIFTSLKIRLHEGADARGRRGIFLESTIGAAPFDVGSGKHLLQWLVYSVHAKPNRRELVDRINLSETLRVPRYR